MKIVIIGGGITGLTAAYFLSQAKHQVIVFEKENILGGLVSSFKTAGWDWPLEKFYHHFFSSDQELKVLIEKLNLKDKLLFKKPKTSIFIDQEIFRFDNLKSILLFPKLNLIDKLRLGLTTVIMKINPFWKPLEEVTAFDFIKTTMGERNLNLIWKPLFVSKFGKDAAKIPATFFWTRIKKRSFKLGYLKQGMETLVNSLIEEIKQNQGQILTKQEITKIAKFDGKFKIRVNNEDYPEKFDIVIAAIPPQILLKIVDDLSVGEQNCLTSLNSLGSLCLMLELKKSFLPDGTYWLNINETDFPFVAVVEHTNFIDKKYYSGNTILYVGGYYPNNHPFFKMTKEQIFEKFLPFLKKINPSYDFKLLTPRNPRGRLLNFELFTNLYAQPIASLNYSQNIPSFKTSLPGLYWISLHHVYPQDRGINYAILLGRKVANEINRKTLNFKL